MAGLGTETSAPKAHWAARRRGAPLPLSEPRPPRRLPARGPPIGRAGWALSPCLALAEGRRFISDQSRRKDLSDRPPPERRSPNPQLLTFPEAGAVLWAFLQKPQEAGEENFDQTRFLEDSLLK
ncbi:spexin [Vicugna pacos]|uniref:Spexin n=1 Tax=Vicugna pacos TaxID=30538 RepID=A0ABM5CQB8_VICPA